MKDISEFPAFTTGKFDNLDHLYGKPKPTGSYNYIFGQPPPDAPKVQAKKIWEMDPMRNTKNRHLQAYLTENIEPENLPHFVIEKEKGPSYTMDKKKFIKRRRPSELYE